jgi:hypothetical protein
MSNAYFVPATTHEVGRAFREATITLPGLNFETESREREDFATASSSED